ncbi:hydroxyethylthiazole kinase [Polytolypa hystricis UAMH7299]|uniref:Hydroxyethylthiazole kinase n=1 Tax=Polytolypa hystricis (strain UAMH7299) TaxID=1447883 RepID=A0A2B7WFK5_POLH7|nr:hydroxyethylthiazole kinase [Polytolypa hystricis UAMH7299]
MATNLSLYLVTDSTPAILGDRDLCTVVEEAIKGGVTIVQYRDKHSDTGVQITTAKKLHEITRAHNIPLIINDRVDIALAVGAEGIHVGQDDMDVEEVKKMMPEGAIIGASVSSVEEARIAVEKGATYLGIGAIYATPTKKDTKSIRGPAGAREILSFLSTLPDMKIGTVAIGGINLSNVQRVLYKSQSTSQALGGVAVVSAIIGATDPKHAAALLSSAISLPPSFATTPFMARPKEAAALISEVPHLVHKVATENPLCHNMINYVVANFAANTALAVGASPIMSGYGPEAPDLAKNGGALLINIGTLTGDSVDHYLQAVQAYNEVGGPVVLDPVGAAATQVRRDAVKKLLAGGYFDLIKGNESELKYLYSQGGGHHQVGVDSGPSTLGSKEKAKLVLELARRERCIVLLTGPIDYLSDGERVVAVGNGHKLLGQVTGTGCVIGTLATAFLAIHRSDKLLSVLSALLVFEIAAENAAARDSVQGPGTFVAALLDELYKLRMGVVAAGGEDGKGKGKEKEGNNSNVFAQRAKINLVAV